MRNKKKAGNVEPGGGKEGQGHPYLELAVDDGVGSGLLGVYSWVPASDSTCVLPMVGLSWKEESIER